jgi:hypothetical protein
MESRLKNFFADMALDNDRLVAYLRDPQLAMSAANLSTEEVETLKSGNTHAVFASVSGLSYDGKEPLAHYASALTNYSPTMMAEVE